MLYTSNTFVLNNYPIKEADVIFLGVPFASCSLSKPALYGPIMVRESLKLKEDYINGKNVFGKLKICDIGDIEIVPGSYELTAKRIRDTIKSIKHANKNAFLVFVGGEHTITFPIIESLKPKTIVQLDAHSDLMGNYLGNKYMQQTWAYHASRFAKIIQVGVNSLNKEERDYIKKSKNVKIVSAKELQKMKLEKPIHLTIDIDVLDPSYIETGFPEGKMKPEELFKIIEKISCDSLDIVEIAGNSLPNKTGFIAAEIIMRILAKRA